MAAKSRRKNPFRFLTRKFPKRMQKKLVLLFLVIVLVFVGLLVRVIYLNMEKGELYTRQVLNQQNYDSQEIPYKRGDILSSDGTKLATSEKVYNVILDPYALNQEDEDVQKATEKALEQCFGIKSDAVELVLENTPNSRYSILQKKVSYQTGQEFTALMQEDDSQITGVWLESSYVRKYTFDSLACDVIGFTGSDNSGSYGLEAYYDDTLSGVNGRTYGYMDEDANLQRTTKEAEDGNSIVTTIDLGLQQIVEEHILAFNESLKDGATEGEGSKNTAVMVMNPNTGEILAEASYPNYNLNDPQDLSAYYDEEELLKLSDTEKSEILQSLWRNFCVSDTFEPGSVVKPFTLATGFETGVLTGAETYYCGGSLHVGDYDIRCHTTGGHGQITLEQGLAKSCNVVLMNAAFSIGKADFCRYQRIFGFGQKTGIDLPGEASASSLIYTEDDMTETDLATNAFGQNFNATMTQVMSAFCSLINGGTYYKPHLVKQILDASGNVVENVNPEVVKKTVSKETSETLRQYMQGTVEYGTGTAAAVEGYALAGKTGTAEKLPRGTNKNTLSFIGFAPADDPEVAIYVVVDEPNLADQSQTSYVVNLAQEIIADVLPYLNVTKEETE
jgi:stage V sporulation protein D (sporulation-specific penicillin-binding protein)